jgi:Flp pilus assembly pilin Flp
MILVPAWTYLQSRFNRDEDGAALVEYVLLVALIAMVCVMAVQLLGNSTSDKLTSIANDVSSAS